LIAASAGRRLFNTPESAHDKRRPTHIRCADLQADIREEAMTNPSEQLGDLHKKSIDAATKLSQLSLENSKRIIELQVETARTLFDGSVSSARALSEAKDPQAAMALRAQFAQETAQKLMDAARRMGEIGAEAQTEFSSMLGEQLSQSGQEMMQAFQKFMPIVPGGNQNALAAMQQAFSTAQGAFDQIAKASSAALNLGGKGKSAKEE
jgi:phasin family protein